MKPVWETLHPYPEVAEGRVTEDSFVVSIGAIHERLEHNRNIDIDQRYLDPEGFYRRTHFTEAMKQLLRQVTTRLKKGAAQSIHHLQVGMGGGKSHTLLLLYYLAKHKDKALPYLKREGIADDVPPFRVAVIDGSRISPTFGQAYPDQTRVLTLWGLLFKQLGIYDKYSEADKLEEAPDIGMLKEALGAESTLILIDELTLYITSATPRIAQRVQVFLQNLTTAVKETPGCALVVTTPIGVYPEALKQVTEILNRYCSPTMVAAGREYKNIRRRALYTDDFNELAPVMEETAQTYQSLYRTHLKDKAPASLEPIMDNYPFHPTVDKTMQKLKDHQAFQEVRDELRFLAGLVYSVHKARDPDTALITTGDADLEDQYVRGGTISKLRDPVVVSRLDTDLDERLAEIPEEIRALSKRVLAAIVINSLSGSPLERGVTRDEAVYSLLSPAVNPTLIDEAVKQIVKHLWFVNLQGDRYIFGQPNVSKLIGDYVKKVENDQSLRGRWWDRISGEVRDWRDGAHRQYAKHLAEKQATPLFNLEDVIPWVNRDNEIPDDKAPKLVLTDYIIPEDEARSTRQRLATSTDEAKKAVEDLYQMYGQSPRNYKNTVFFLVADRRLVENNGPMGYAKQLMALEEMLKDQEELKTLIGETGVRNLEKLKADTIRDLRPSCLAAYRYLVYPAAEGLSVAELEEERRAVDQIIRLVEEKLDNLGKIVRDVTVEVLLDRYWPKGKTQVEVKDLIEGFYRRPEIELISGRQVVEKRIREAITKGRVAYSTQNEVYYLKEPQLIDDKGVLVKNPDVASVQVEAVDNKGDSLNIRLLVDGRREIHTPTTIQDLKGVEHTLRPSAPSEYTFKGWRDGYTQEERTMAWDASKTLVLEYMREEIPAQDVRLDIRAVNLKNNKGLEVAILLNGASYQTPLNETFSMGKRCTINIATPTGMTFNGWSDGSKNAERVVTCDYDKVLTATYMEVTPGVEVVKWSGPTGEGVKNLESLIEGQAKTIKVNLETEYAELTRHSGAILQLLRQPYTIELQATGGRSQGFEMLTVLAKAGSDRQGSVKSCLTQLKEYLDSVEVRLEKNLDEYKTLSELVTVEALEALEKLPGDMSYEVQMLTDPTRKPEPTRSLKNVLDEFRRVA